MANLTASLDAAAVSQLPTVCGLTPLDVHDRFWAARGVQVVRLGMQSEAIPDVELYLLLDPNLLVLFDIRALIEDLVWVKPEVLWVRLRDQREQGCREFAVADARGRLLRFERRYERAEWLMTRVAVTPSPEVALRWQEARTPLEGWRKLRHDVPANFRATVRLPGRTYDARNRRDLDQSMRDILAQWSSPEATVSRLRLAGDQLWRDQEVELPADLRSTGPVWIGAGRQPPPGAALVGPAVLWDDPQARPPRDGVRWAEIEPPAPRSRPARPRQTGAAYERTKRAMDMLVSGAMLLLLAPLFPLILLAIYLEDGRPFFFGHRRETLGGRVFHCWKFRSMRRDADRLQRELAARNQADGPQFFIEDDPRITRVGWIIRKYYLDELPQLWNVFRGDMSLVGPRPSPYKENQFCPGWREARLSVRPGMTGLWQVSRSRVPGRDFQEWIQYDLEYVERRSLGLDLWILWRTFLMVLRIR